MENNTRRFYSIQT